MSPGAKHTFVALLMLAGECGQNGSLTVKGRPILASEIAEDTGYSVAKQRKYLTELAQNDFIFEENGSFLIQKFDEIAGEKSLKNGHAERQKRYRERHGDAERDASRVTQKVTDKNREDKILPSVGANAPTDGNEGNEPWRFAEYVFNLARAADLVAEHKDSAKEIRADLAKAKSLLEAHGAAECAKRAQRLIKSLLSGDVKRGAPTCRTLATVWDFDCIAGITKSAKPDGGANYGQDAYAGMKRL
jgi:hypothetical protein